MRAADEMEICRLYREAKYQGRQEQILADLYLCSTEDIHEILVRHGVYNQKAKTKGRNSRGRARGSHFTKRKVSAG